MRASVDASERVWVTFGEVEGNGGRKGNGGREAQEEMARERKMSPPPAAGLNRRYKCGRRRQKSDRCCCWDGTSAPAPGSRRARRG
eukprot:1746509-Pleurochrysis_carterae.AAC.1